MSRSALHQTARAYAEDGIPVFPCLPGSKEPATDHGFKDATTDLGQIDKWWQQHPDYNVAIEPEKAGWAVVDVDPDGFGAVDGLDLPATYTVRTPRGGSHFYFAGSIGASASKLAKGIDTRGRGSYVLVPPSKTADGVYSVASSVEPVPLPDRIGEAAGRVRERATRASDGDLDTPANIARAKALIAATPGAVEHQGSDHATLTLASAVMDVVSEAMALKLLWEHWVPRCEGEWDEAWLAEKVANAARYHQNEIGAHALGDGSAMREIGKKLAGEQPKGRYALRWGVEQDNQPDPTWLIPELMMDETTVMIVGETGSFKSYLALDMALGIATGTKTFGSIPERRAPVIYCTAEGRVDLEKRRKRAWAMAHGVEISERDFATTALPLLSNEALVNEWLDELKELKDRPGAIFIDTVAKLMAGMDENSSGDAGKFIKLMDDMKDYFHCPIIGIHHESDKKGANKGARGSSAFHAGIDTTLLVEADRDVKGVQLRVKQHKDADEPRSPWWFEGRMVGPQLAFFPLTHAEWLTLTDDKRISGSDVGRTLRELGAIGSDKAISTYALASTLAEPRETDAPEETHRHIERLGRKLAKMGKKEGRLEGFSIMRGREMWWCLPA